jgi:hypothetical protein
VCKLLEIRQNLHQAWSIITLGHARGHIENAIESETANPDNALESEASKPNQADKHTSSSPAQPVRPNLRRTTSIRKRHGRFRGSSFNSEGSSSDGQTLT